MCLDPNDLPNIFQADVIKGPALVMKPGVAQFPPHDADWTPVIPRTPFIPYAVGPAPGKRPIEDAIFSRLHSTGTSDAAQAIQLDLLWKFSRGDWHGVSDAANDLRVLEAEEKRK